MALFAEDEKDNEFNFESWINQYQLNNIKQCFVDYDLTTLESLSMNNTNYMKLLGDKRITSNPHLFQNITQGMLSLNELRDKKQKLKQEKGKNKLFVLPENENKELMMLQNYTKQFQQKQHKFKSNISTHLQSKKQENNSIIKQYNDNNSHKMNNIRIEMNDTFEKLQNMLKKHENTLKSRINEYENTVKAMEMNHTQKTKIIDHTLDNCLSMIDEDTLYFKSVLKKCKDIVNKYDNGIDVEDIHQFVQSNNEQRANEIAKTCNDAKNHYENRCMILNDYIDEINKYTQNELQLPKPSYSLIINKDIHDNININIDKLIQIKHQNDDEKQETEHKPTKTDVSPDNHRRSTSAPKLRKPSLKKPSNIDILQIRAASTDTTNAAAFQYREEYIGPYGYRDFHKGATGDPSHPEYVVSQTQWLHANLSKKTFIRSRQCKSSSDADYHSSETEQSPQSASFRGWISKKKHGINTEKKKKNLINRYDNLESESSVSHTTSSRSSEKHIKSKKTHKYSDSEY